MSHLFVREHELLVSSIVILHDKIGLLLRIGLRLQVEFIHPCFGVVSTCISRINLTNHRSCGCCKTSMGIQWNDDRRIKYLNDLIRWR